MYFNNFSVRVPEGAESAGYVALSHGQHYTLRLRNSRPVRCDARVTIDGKLVGVWRINANQSISIERPADDTGRFTFYRAGTPEARQALLPEHDPGLGLISVTFTPEIEVQPLISKEIPSPQGQWIYTATSHTSADTPRSYTYSDTASLTDSVSATNSAGIWRAAGGTGLSGHSHQVFHDASPIAYDFAQQVTIHLRLVADDLKGRRPLASHSTPVPPPVH